MSTWQEATVAFELTSDTSVIMITTTQQGFDLFGAISCLCVVFTVSHAYKRILIQFRLLCVDMMIGENYMTLIAVQ